MKNEELLTIPSYQELVKQYHGHTDREAAILASSFVEAFTEKFLRAFMKEHADVDALFKGYGPLSSFAARIASAWALGYISDSIKNDLTCIRNIRNHFAHHPADTSLAHSEARKWLAKLTTSQPVPESDGGEHVEIDPRLQYLFAVSFVIAVMHNTILDLEKAKSRIARIAQQTPPGDSSTPAAAGLGTPEK
jgi:DNA-binding MltR family transcriptional regulator